MAQQETRVAIVGGGIAGLFCARVLGEQQGYQVDLFETASRLGGKIRTVRLDKNNQELAGTEWTNDKLNFYVEFGPMRLELDKQLLLKALLTDLGIEAKEGPDVSNGSGEEADPYLVPFPNYTSPSSEHDPRYELRPDEQGKSPLDLMMHAFVRILARLKVPDETRPIHNKLENLKDRLKLAAALAEPAPEYFIEWVKEELEPEDYWDIQTLGCVAIDDGVDERGKPQKLPVPLYRLGFWNLLSDHLSHDALNKIRDLGTFYHLLPENPNAAEWLTWWMMGLSASDHMEGIFGGMECIIERMSKSLVDNQNITIKPNRWVLAIEKNPGDNKLHLRVRDSLTKKDLPPTDEYDHVILAVPRRAAQEIYRRSHRVFEDPKVGDLLESAFGFPMVKTFAVLKERWWEKNNMANRLATRMPTRELHYWKPQDKDDAQGLIMAYTDRPASAYWAAYVPAGPQIDAHRGRPKDKSPSEKDAAEPDKTTYHPKPLKKVERTLMLDRLAAYLDENNGEQTVRPHDVAWYGIRDWGRAPFSGANHAWRPGRKYWTVMRRLARMDAIDSTSKVHICGEAYSDYHGFIEGPLRSASYVLHLIFEGDDAQEHDVFEKFLSAKPTDPASNNSQASPTALRVDPNYLKGLRYWAKKLDGIRPGDDDWEQFMD